MPLYKRRPLIVEAHQMTAHHQEQEMLASWCGGLLLPACWGHPQGHIKIQNSDGDVEARPGDWVVKEINENYYVYKAPYFELTHTLTHTGRET